ncbi:MAG: NAD-dependent succinate-semialdehyde dehydrogenase [Bacteroidota bacterium]
MKQVENQNLIQQNAFVNGEWITAKNGATFDVINPFDTTIIKAVADCGKTETKEAIQAAHDAFEVWKKRTANDRSSVLHKWYALILKNIDDLAVLLTLEQGKPLAEARSEIIYGASFIQWFAEEVRRTFGDIIPPHRSDVRIMTIKQPIGVVAAITPWNFPVAMITRKVAPALAAGCTVVIKPSEETPLSALALATLAEEAGFPKGVFNVIPTLNAKEVGEEMTSNPLVRKLSFTGSTAVGKLLMRQCAATVKKVSLELGGNAPFIVFDDADIDAAVKGAIAAKYRNAGQTCISANRIYVQYSIHEGFLEKYKKAIDQLVIGNGLDPATIIGPLINQKAIKKVNRLIKNAEENGAILHPTNYIVEQNLYPPVILTNVELTMQIHNEEIFGPVTAIYKFSTEEEVIQMANNTPYGLASYFYGRDYARIWRVAEALEYGMVGINTGAISTAVAPFGGVKESGIGREGSTYGIEEYMEVKYMCWGEV